MIKLQYKHLEFGLFANNTMKTPYWSIRLVDRKGWQRHTGENQEQHLSGLSLLDCILK
jgi:hypothetical protein